MVPQGYKQTEVGIIPEDWEIKQISEFTDIITGGTPNTSRPEYWDGDIKWMNSGELNLKFVKDVEGRITNEGLNNSSTHLIPTNCVLIGLAGQGKTRGTAAFNLIPLCTNQSIAAILPSNEHNSLYLYYVVDSLYDYLRLLSSGDGGRGGLNKNLLNSLQIKMPKSIEEQRRVAEVLSDVDGLITALDKKIAKKKHIKQAAMQQLLTGKKRLQGFYEENQVIALSKLGHFVSGNGFPLQYQGALTGDYPFYKVSDFNTKGNETRLNVANNYITINVANILNCNIIPSKSIIFAKIGAAVFLERKKLCSSDCCIDNNMMSFQPNENIDALYLCYFLQTVSFGELVETTALPSLGVKTLGNIAVYLPSTIKEQQAIATILSDMDAEISDLERKRDKYKLLKHGIMQKLLTGQIRLK